MAAHLIALALPIPAAALTFSFADPATATVFTREKLGRHRLPTGPWVSTGTPTRLVEGAVERRAWRIDAPGKTTLDMAQSLRDQLVASGYRVMFECETAACGGYDFRFEAEVLPEPDMHVDLGNFQFVAAERGAGDVVSLLISRSAASGHVQMIRVFPPDAAEDATPAGPDPAVTNPLASQPQPVPTAAPTGTTALAESLLTSGAVVLEGLAFASGSDQLSDGIYPSLAALASWLTQNPERQIAVVGHTDAAGGLDVNIGLSRRRAASVRARLIADYSIPPQQVEALGAGYLAPRATNLTDEGRTLNRRVEAILTSTR